MIEPEQSDAALPASPSDQGDSFARIYDFFKHMTGIVLVSIGGVLGLLKGGDTAIKPAAFYVVIGSLSAAGLVAMNMLAQLAALGFKGSRSVEQMRRSVLLGQRLVVLFLLFGLGVFMGVSVMSFVK